MPIKTDSFEHRSDRVFEPHDVGQVVMINHYARSGKLVSYKSHIGTLVGFTEDRGGILLPAEGDGHEAFRKVDISNFSDYIVTLKFADGSQVTIDEGDRATVTVYGEVGA